MLCPGHEPTSAHDLPTALMRPRELAATIADCCGKVQAQEQAAGKSRVPGKDAKVRDPPVQPGRIPHEHKLPDAVQHHVAQEGCKGSVRLGCMEEVCPSICQAASHFRTRSHQPDSRDGCDHDCGPCKELREGWPLDAWDGALGGLKGRPWCCARGDAQSKVGDHEDIRGKLRAP